MTAVRSRECRFGPLTVTFDDRVLAPRPWTLLQSRWAADLAATAAPGRMLELCAGAGQIGLAAAVLSGRSLVQVEADPVAVHYARANAALAGQAANVEVRPGRIDTAVGMNELFPIVLADPPYLPSGDVVRWPNDPVAAIDGGADGLELVRTCLEVAAEHLADGGPLLLQVAGDAQARRAKDLVEATPALSFTYRGICSHDPERAVVQFTKVSSTC